MDDMSYFPNRDELFENAFRSGWSLWTVLLAFVHIVIQSNRVSIAQSGDKNRKVVRAAQNVTRPSLTRRLDQRQWVARIALLAPGSLSACH